MALSTRHLAVLPLPGAYGVPVALAAVDRLERAGPLDVSGAAVVERRGDGTRHVAPVSWRGGAEVDGAQIDIDAWTWLLDGILETPGPDGGEDPGAGLGGAGLSQSFVAEVRHVVAGADRSLALVVAGLDPGAVASELRALPGARLVYGVLPQPVLHRLLRRPPGDASHAPPFET